VVCMLLQSCGGRAGSGVRFDADAVAAADAITETLIRDVVNEIAADSYAGRAPGTGGDRATRKYLAARMAELGFEPGAAGGFWDQPFALVGINTRQPARWGFARGGATRAFDQGEDYIVVSGRQAPVTSIEAAELVFVGYGIEAPEYGWDDFAGVDLNGKVLLMLNNDPDWDAELFAGNERLYYGRWSYKYESALRQGAAGAIVIHTDASAGYPWQVVQTSWTGEQFQLPSDDQGLQAQAWMTEEAARELVEFAGFDLDALVDSARRREFAPVPLNVSTSIRLETALTRTESANVIGVLHGSDSRLANEFVIYTAHHDHLGVAADMASGDGIYNGARDNASGVGIVLSIGAAFAALKTPPRRSIMLLFVGAEEQGLLGSQYYASYPTVAPGRIAANINYDSGNIWGRTRDITFVGLGKSSLDRVAEAVAEHENRELKPDQFPDRGYYYRSDQFSFAQIGVPAFYFRAGTDFVGQLPGWGEQQLNAYEEQHYHQPSDEISAAWNFEGMVDDARFGFLAGWVVADQDRIPNWNPGDEFEAARQAAIAELDELSAR